MSKKDARIKRAIKTRKTLYKLDAIRLVVHRTCRHIYAQIISKDNSNVLVTASTAEKLISNQLITTSNKKAAAIVGTIIAERSIKKGITNVSFDRSGFKYHGRVKTLADCARKTGLRF
ncbi:50S ribosomal protein L18 [Blochmannia endosymbiont of Camponotus sp. C-003]|uniref:50S ribosomal protein L18 n=1 Tax=unclassified Candidatus Blochmanniella TaxID=711328 RepID=UPI002025A751|nr:MULTISPECIES: 50S ribosomal protein L18 [unclassified Candidatus Blochmannia]URJ23042.1 50S ribosomal protein L18 [Blochmannia endosymbiont of Camponotus sp. C-003]URJ28510.1 50S ribosomal protein L18 [Blochmannia endosymbiont of Camponotus sp. C-046]